MKRCIRPIFGLEFEVAISALDAQTRRLSSGRFLPRIIAAVKDRHEYLPMYESSGVFLSNGGRLYIDCDKPEITTPEVTNPTDACRYSRAGERILLEAASDVVRDSRHIETIILTRNNQGYGSMPSTWACHESYGHACHTPNISNDFIPHAVSRIIFTGAGGFDNRSNGIVFLLSPRVAHLDSVVSESTQANRGIFNTKNEPLSEGPYHRLHVICGENQSSIRAAWLKMATTAVVIAMAEAGVAPGKGLAMRSPLRAMKTFSRDATLTATVPMESGEQLSALDIQRRLLDKATRLDVSGPINHWLPDCCRLWEETLDRLERGVLGVQRSIDWAIKLDLFTRYIEQRGFTWERIEQWNRVLDQFAFLKALADESSNDVDAIKANASEWSKHCREFPKLFAELDRKELPEILKLRQELFEIDTRFGDMSQNGIFNSLDSQKLLDHHVAGVEDICRAMTDPPRGSRAELRGSAIRDLRGAGKQGASEWTAVWNHTDCRRLDLSDPFTTRAKWRPVERHEEEMRPWSSATQQAFEFAQLHFERGEYEPAYRTLRHLMEFTLAPNTELALKHHRLMAQIMARRGFSDSARWLDAVYSSDDLSLNAVCDYLRVNRFVGLQPGRSFGLWCRRGFVVLQETRDPNWFDVALLRCSHAYDVFRRGNADEAWELYRDGIPARWREVTCQRDHARIDTERAGVLRQLGRYDEALALLNEVEQTQMVLSCHGDIADLTRMESARIMALQGRFADAWQALNSALQTQRESLNVVGEVRTLLLMARVCRNVDIASVETDLTAVRRRVMQICRDRSALGNCPLAQQIVSHWDAWVAGDEMSGVDDPFWGL